MKSFPMQPIVMVKGVARFHENRIVSAFMLAAQTGQKLDLNDIARDRSYTAAERMQFAQLIGYSVSGFGDLSYADKDVVRRADRKAAELK